ncbi:hypothetical protein [Pseudomonas plecoglossicida]
MSDFSPLNIFKDQAKKHARKFGMKLSTAQNTLARKAGFATYHELSVVAQRNAQDPRLMLAAFGVTDFAKAIHADSVYPKFELELEKQLSVEISETNASAFTITELYTHTHYYNQKMGVLDLHVSFSYEGKQDPNRPYYGRAFLVQTAIDLVRRDGKWSIAEDGVIITHLESEADHDQKLGWDAWGHTNGVDDYHRPHVTLAQALSNDLCLSFTDAESTAIAKLTANALRDDKGSYWIDIEPVFKGATKALLLGKYGTLKFKIDPKYFDDELPSM